MEDILIDILGCVLDIIGVETLGICEVIFLLVLVLVIVIGVSIIGYIQRDDLE